MSHNKNLDSIVKRFRKDWRGFQPGDYPRHVDQVPESLRAELTSRLLIVELEYHFNCPDDKIDAYQEWREREDTCTANVHLFKALFPILRKHEDLLIQLAVVEYALRIHHGGEDPNKESYFTLVRHSQDKLSRLLDETQVKLRNHQPDDKPTSQIGKNSSTTPELSHPVSLDIESLPTTLGCFLLLSRLGQGGMGSVFRGIDLRVGAPVAIKVMRRNDPWSVYRFNEEFGWLSRLHHKNVVGLYDAFSEGEFRYFAMELVEGRSIDDWLQEKKRSISTCKKQLVETFTPALQQLAEAIFFLHSRGLLHRDIKPSNVMVDASDRVVLLDLGLTVSVGTSIYKKYVEKLSPIADFSPATPSPGAKDGVVVTRSSVLEDHGWAGTPTFMAPEAHIGRPGTSSDWFSFGVLMYNLLTDSYPGLRSKKSTSKQTNWGNFSEAIQFDRLDMLQQLEGYPEDIVDLCVELVTKPEHERPNGEKILETLGISPQNLNTPMEILDPSLCVGREEHLTQLDTILESSQSSAKAHACLLQGEIGSGKTTLLENWSSKLSERNLLKLQGRCYEGDHTPLRLLNLLLQDVIRRINHNDSRQSQILNAFAPDLTLTFRQVQVGDSPLKEPVFKADDIDHAQRRHTSLLAFHHFLCELSTIQPILIVIDDAHHADEDSLQQLRALQDSNEDGLQFNGLILLASDSDEASKLSNPAIVDWFSPSNLSHESTHLVKLDQIDDTLGRQLMNAWAVSETITEDKQVSLIQRAEGNIFLLRQLVRNELGDRRKPSGRRNCFARLPAEIERVLQFIAVAGQPIGFYQLEKTAKLPPERLLGYTMFLISEGWIKRIDRDGSALFEISHKLFRREIINSTESDRLKRRHFRLARFIISETPTPWTRIANHYLQADDQLKAAAAYHQAAIEAVDKGAFAAAEDFLSRAEIPGSTTQASNRSSVLSLRAQCMAGTGRSSEAGKIYDQLQLEATDTPNRHIDYGCAASEQWINAGAVHEGLGRLRRVLPEIGLSNPRRLTVTQRIQQLALLRKLTRTKPDDDCEPLKDSEQTLSRVVTSLTFLDSQVGNRLAFWLRNRIKDNGTKRDRAEVLMRLGAMTYARKRQRRLSHQMIWKGRQLARESRSIVSRANGYFCLYQATIQRGKHRKAALCAAKARELYAQVGAAEKWESCFLEWASLRCMWQEGRLSEVVTASQALRERHQENPETMSQFWCNTMQPVFSLLLLGQTEAAENAINAGKQAIRHLDFDSPRFFLWQTSVLSQLYSGDALKACQVLKRDWNHLFQQPIFRSDNYRVAAHSIRCCIGLVGQRVRPNDPQFHAELRIGLKGMQRLPEPAFSVLYQTFRLVIRQTCGHPVGVREFDRCIEQLKSHDHHLYAVALQWHKGLAFNLPNDVAQARAFFTDQQCVAPEKLMDMILPLPQHATKAD